MKRVYTDYFKDIANSIKDIKSFIRNQSFKQFTKDRKTVNAVIRSLEIIGEAARNIPREIKSRYPTVPWKQMSGMRDKIVHEYFGVDLEIVWQTVKEDLPKLQEIIKAVKFNEEK